MSSTYDFFPAVAGTAIAVGGYLFARRETLRVLRRALERASASPPPAEPAASSAAEAPVPFSDPLETAKRERARILAEAEGRARIIRESRDTAAMKAIAKSVRDAQARIEQASAAAASDLEDVAAAAAADLVAELKRALPEGKQAQLDAIGEELDRLLRA